MLQFILHLIGDYITQSDWMAQNKTRSTWAAFCHATVYALPFLLIASLPAFFVIWSTHLIIDRFRLARYVVWAKNVILAPALWRQLTCTCDALGRVNPNEPMRWSNCSATGYPSEAPAWLSVWLLIAADNTLHLLINFLALEYL